MCKKESPYIIPMILFRSIIKIILSLLFYEYFIIYIYFSFIYLECYKIYECTFFSVKLQLFSRTYIVNAIGRNFN